MKHEIDAEGIWNFLPKRQTFAATDIEALTHDWPQVVRDATGLKWEGDQWVSRLCGQVNYVTVYWAFVGSGLAWLAEKQAGPSLELRSGGVWQVFTSMRFRGSGPCDHPLAAVSATVLAAAKEYESS